jgi:hypothetical protein
MRLYLRVSAIAGLVAPEQACRTSKMVWLGAAAVELFFLLGDDKPCMLLTDRRQ